MPEVSKYWEQVISINNWQQYRIYKMVINNLFGNVNKKKIVILGFSFKSNTNDTRESPAILICKNLLNEGANLTIHDPKVEKIQVEFELRNVGIDNNPNWIFTKNLEGIFDNADAIIVLTEWEIYKEINWKSVSKVLRNPSWLFDTRRIIDPDVVNDCEFNFWQVGRGNHL